MQNNTRAASNNARIGGVLSIVAGGFGILYMFAMIILGILMMGLAFDDTSWRYDSFNGIDPRNFMLAIWAFLGFFYAVIGALAIVGGVFALKKKYWGLALAGAIAGTITFFPCGVVAIIFTAMGKPEFQGQTPAAPAAPVEKVVG